MKIKGELFKSTLFLSLILFIFTSLTFAEDIKSLPFLTETYHETKNIAFVGAVGGSSHFNWVLTILDELSDRKHKVNFFTKDGAVKFGKLYPNINTISYGPDPVSDDESDKILNNMEEHKDHLGLMRDVVAIFSAPWEKDFTNLVDLFEKYKIDTVLCDQLVDACVDAAKTLKIPFIVTLIAESTTGNAPYINMNHLTMGDFTTEFESIYVRFKNTFIFPVKIIMKFAGFFQEMGGRKKALGVTGSPDPSVEWKDNIKMINNLFGFTPARPVGPLVEHVGPILPRRYNPLDGNLKDFLDNHKRVGYVALGQLAKPNTRSLTKLLTSLLETYEAGKLDGAVWAASVNTKHRFPEFVKTSSNKSYDVSQLLENKYPDLYFTSWAPQIALLLHPSTHIFISHGGVGSWIESMYAGVPVVVYPFFGDQLGNGLMVERGDMGAVLDSSMSITEITDVIKRVIADEDGKIRAGVKRTQALVQIHSRNGAKLGADVVEEVAFTNINGKLPHRYEASRKMSFIKANNIDIIGIFITIVLSCLLSFTFILVKIYKFISVVLKSDKKIKTQ